MKYCCECGQPLQSTVPDDGGFGHLVCTQCGFVHYQNPNVLVACLLYHEDKVLWMKRALNPFAGRWAIPGGFMEKGETVEQAACRELREETCLILDPDELAIYGVMSIPAINEVYISLIAPLPSMAFGCTPEASDIRLLSQAELARYERAYAPTTDMLIRDLYGNLIGGTIGCHAAVLMGVNGASSYSRRGKLRT